MANRRDVSYVMWNMVVEEAFVLLIASSVTLGVFMGKGKRELGMSTPVV